LHGEVSELTCQIKAKLEEQYNNLSRKGFRAIGVAYRTLSGHKRDYAVSDEREMVFVGFAAFIDPQKRAPKTQ